MILLFRGITFFSQFSTTESIADNKKELKERMTVPIPTVNIYNSLLLVLLAWDCDACDV